MTFCKSLCVNVSGWLFSVITNAIVITLGGLERKKPSSKQKHNNGTPHSRSVSAEPPWTPGVSEPVVMVAKERTGHSNVGSKGGGYSLC